MFESTILLTMFLYDFISSNILQYEMHRTYIYKGIINRRINVYTKYLAHICTYIQYKKKLLKFLHK